MRLIVISIKWLQGPKFIGQELSILYGLSLGFLIVKVVALDLDNSGLDPKPRDPHKMANPSALVFHGDLS
jgi:hypothetical protein